MEHLYRQWVRLTPGRENVEEEDHFQKDDSQKESDIEEEDRFQKDDVKEESCFQKEDDEDAYEDPG